MLDDIRKHGYVLTPGRYIGAEAAEEEAEPFEEKMALRRNLAERAIDGVFNERGFSLDWAV